MDAKQEYQCMGKYLTCDSYLKELTRKKTYLEINKT